jgi:hypothetical protein
VKKAQISKLENSLTDARFESIIKVFEACGFALLFKCCAGCPFCASKIARTHVQKLLNSNNLLN